MNSISPHPQSGQDVFPPPSDPLGQGDAINAHVIEVKHNEDINASDDDGWHASSPSKQGWEYLGVVDNWPKFIL